MTHASDDQARNDGAPPVAVHDPDNLVHVTTTDELLADLRAWAERMTDRPLDLRAMQPDEDDALTDDPIPFVPAISRSSWDRAVEVVVTLADARRVVDMAKHALQHPPYPGYDDRADRAALERFANVIDTEWLAQ